jgi:hypothetical protein
LLKWLQRRTARLLLVLVGIFAGQVFLYGPCLIGRKILLPVDLLAREGMYLPLTPETTRIEPRNLALSDLVDLFEPARRFAAAELHAGRLPMWAPYQFAGAPFIWPKFSPFMLIQSCASSPVMLAWAQLAVALIAGLGAYLFCLRVLAVGFWPATIVAWCYPLTAFFVLWQGYPTASAVGWLPWLLWMCELTARGENRIGPLGLSVATCLVLISGHLDVAAQILLGAGLFTTALFWLVHRGQSSARVKRAAFGLVAGFGLGFFLASPYVLPVMEYTQTSGRMARRSGGEEERPPIGLSALPEAVLPEIYGSSQTGSVRLNAGTESETAAAGYAGIVAALLVAPLAWRGPRHRALNWVWLFLALFGLSWCLNLPGFVQALRLPGLNLLSHNRLVFLTAFAVLTLTALGLEHLRTAPFHWNGWFWFPAGVLAALCLYCGYRAFHLPQELATDLEQIIREGGQVGLTHDIEGVRRVQSWFQTHYAAGAILCGLGLAGWLVARARPRLFPRLLLAIGAVLVADLLWFAHGRSPQCDPALYFPPIPALEQLARSSPGRVIGYHCLPASLAAMCGLNDIRGYDGVDPQRMVELLSLTAAPDSSKRTYAETQWLSPAVSFTPEGNVRLPPLLDMLGVRYVIFRGAPRPGIHPAFQSHDYSVLINTNALPRIFVPLRIEVATDARERLRKLNSGEFDPREVAFVEEPLNLPAACHGRVTLTSEISSRVVLDVQMETAGLVVLADHWNEGWHAFLNGRPVPILRTNHVLRGVVVPAGKSRLDFQYAPASFTWGVRLGGLALSCLSLWTAVLFLRRGLK